MSKIKQMKGIKQQEKKVDNIKDKYIKNYFLHNSQQQMNNNNVYLLSYLYLNKMRVRLSNIFLKFEIRKDIKRNNEKVNHRSYISSLAMPQWTWYQVKYHKKKTILFLLLFTLGIVYDYHKELYYWVSSLQSPIYTFKRFLYGKPKIPNTIKQQNTRGIQLSPVTIEMLTKLYYEADRQLYFGVGRFFMHKVYKELGLLQKPDEQRGFWIATGFHKKRNQVASGIGMTEFIKMFKDAHKRLKEKKVQISQQQLLLKFISVFIQKFPEVRKWEKQFNVDRESQYLKNVHGEQPKRQGILREFTKNNPLTSFQQAENHMKSLGLGGMNLTDKYLYWANKQVWLGVKLQQCKKKLNLITTEQNQKHLLRGQVNRIHTQMSKIQQTKQQIQTKYRQMYEQELI